MKTPASIELLEPRIAPASVFTFTDIDGDTVKIISSSGDLNAPGVVTTVLAGAVGGEQLTRLDLRDPSFQGAVITTKVVRAPGGDGFVHIGRIDATGRDLAQVKIKGDLGAIDVGDSDTSSPALKQLSVRSMGRFGLSTQQGLGDLDSAIQGRLGKLTVAGDFKEAQIDVSPGEEGSIGSVTIGGSIIGGSRGSSGRIETTGDIGSVTVRGDLIGGNGDLTGTIDAQAKIGAVTIAGSIHGGPGNASARISSDGGIGPVKIGGDLSGGDGSQAGAIFSGAELRGVTIRGSVLGGGGFGTGSIFGDTIGKVKIGGSLVGGSNEFSGQIGFLATGDIASVTIGGSVIGGTGKDSGVIYSDSDIGPIRIGGDLRGGSIFGSEPTLTRTGYIEADRIASLTIGGSMLAGFDSSTAGELTSNASIRVNNDIGPIVVKGSITGTETGDGIARVVISARGQENVAPGARTDIAIRSLTVGGHVEWAKILGGFDVNDPDTAGSNGNASIGPVKVGGDWYSSTISAGVQDGSGIGFGDGGDTVINNAADAIIARIASVKIKGLVIGVPNPFFQNAFIAQQIGFFKAGAFVAPLTPGTDAPIVLTPYTANVVIREV